MRTTLYLVRHAESDWAHGTGEDRPLSGPGAQAARVLADRLIAFPVTAVYSSPYARSVHTVAPLASRLGLPVQLERDLRERELPGVPRDQFDAQIDRTWRTPGDSVNGGEPNTVARSRGLAVVDTVLRRHAGEHVVLATHGSLLALVLNGLDATVGFDFWKQLSYPDAYRLEFDGTTFVGFDRV